MEGASSIQPISINSAQSHYSTQEASQVARTNPKTRTIASKRLVPTSLPKAQTSSTAKPSRLLLNQIARRVQVEKGRRFPSSQNQAEEIEGISVAVRILNG